MKWLAFILNIPWTLIGIITALISMPTKVTFSEKYLACIFNIKSFWWYSWLPGKKGTRAMVNGHVVLLGPIADAADLNHELIHVQQFIREPLIHPFLYTWHSFRFGYRKNKYEEEAYSKSGNRYIVK